MLDYKRKCLNQSSKTNHSNMNFNLNSDVLTSRPFICFSPSRKQTTGLFTNHISDNVCANNSTALQEAIGR